MARKQPQGDASIGKFDILATYVYARGLIDGLRDDEAKQRGMVAAIMRPRAKLGVRKEHHDGATDMNRHRLSGVSLAGLRCTSATAGVGSNR